MFRLSAIAYAICGVTTLLIFSSLVGPWQNGEQPEMDPIPLTAGRVLLVVDEQDVGDVEPDVELEVGFLVANVGSERLWLRQVAWQPGRCATPQPPLCSARPGQTIAVTAYLNSNELAGRGHKHLCFETSDRACRELWLTVRGNLPAGLEAERVYR